MKRKTCAFSSLTIVCKQINQEQRGRLAISIPYTHSAASVFRFCERCQVKIARILAGYWDSFGHPSVSQWVDRWARYDMGASQFADQNATVQQTDRQTDAQIGAGRIRPAIQPCFIICCRAKEVANESAHLFSASRYHQAVLSSAVSNTYTNNTFYTLFHVADWNYHNTLRVFRVIGDEGLVMRHGTQAN